MLQVYSPLPATDADSNSNGRGVERPERAADDDTRRRRCCCCHSSSEDGSRAPASAGSLSAGDASRSKPAAAAPCKSRF